MVKMGYKAAPEQYGPNELLEFAVAAEAAGFDTLEASDHFNPWDPTGQACFVWTWLGAAAARTTKIELGTGLTCPILRYNPAVIAQAAATLGVMAPGRAFLAVGTGEALNEYTTTGLWPEYDERQDMLAEAIELIRELWDGKSVTHEGAYYDTRKAHLYTRPETPIPLYVSSLVPDSAPFAAEYGDGLMTVGGEKPDHYKELLQAFDEGAKKAGKDSSTMPKLIELNVAYTDDEQSAIECFKTYWAGTFIPALFDQKIYTPQMSAKNGAAVGAETIKGKACISGNAEDHVEYIRQFVDLGFTHIYVHSPLPDQTDFVQRYGRDVLPKVKAAAGGRQPATAGAS